ncbi:DUF2892 domain-containing protein [Sulfurospirillum sp. 1307]|jgi:hypothetical protein
MKCNVGKKDKIRRLILGTIGLVLSAVYQEWYFYLFTWTAMLTLAFSYCPLYPFFNVDTTKDD